MKKYFSILPCLAWRYLECGWRGLLASQFARLNPRVLW
jgi:hypothetical protein